MSQKEIINIEGDDNLEKIEEDIIAAAEKAGRKNVIVNIFTLPHRALNRRWHVRYKFNKKHLVMDLLIAAGVLFLIGLNIFWWYGGFHYFTDKFVLDIETRSSDLSADLGFISGHENIFIIHYANNNKFVLEEVVLSLKLPKRFSLKTVSAPAFDWQHKTLKLGNLAPGANGSFSVNGAAFGAVGEGQQFIVQAFFFKTDKRGRRLWGQFSQSQFYVYPVATEALDGSQFSPDFAWPPSLVNGQIVSLPMEIVNSAIVDYKNLRLVPRFDAVVMPVAEKEFVINEWAGGERKNFDWQFKLNTEQTSQELAFALYLIYEGEWLKQGEWLETVTVLQPKFSVSAQLNNHADTINPGQKVEILINYNNSGKFTIENTRLTLELVGDYWDFNQADLAGGSRQGNKIIWAAKEWPQLALIQPQEKGERMVRLAVKEYIPQASIQQLVGQLQAQYRLEGQEVAIRGQSFGAWLNSNLSLWAYPVYFTKAGDQLGRGPLPPRVGEETKYWIFVKMINDINDVENVKVALSLPLNVVWTGKTNVPVGDPLQFNETSKQVSWQISKVPVKSENIGFAFEVGIIPSALQQGTYPTLLSSLVVSGVDKVTGTSLEKDFGAITTQLVEDVIGKKNDGIVK